MVWNNFQEMSLTLMQFPLLANEEGEKVYVAAEMLVQVPETREGADKALVPI
jgi:hypothetical protein